MKINKKTLIVTTLVCLVPMLAGALVYERLPETMATHWGIDGAPDGYSSRAFAVFGLPGILAGMNLLLHFILGADPKRQNMSGALVRISLWTPAVVALLCGGLTLAYGLGCDLRMERIAPIFVGLVFIVIGNYLPKTKQSYTLGIRVPGTLNSEENWNRTHRLAGWLFVIGGLCFIVMSFIGWSLAAFLILIAVVGLVPMVYSYILYRKGI